MLGGGSLVSHTYFQNVRDMRESGGGPPEIESEPYVEQLCKQNQMSHRVLTANNQCARVALRSAVKLMASKV